MLLLKIGLLAYVKYNVSLKTPSNDSLKQPLKGMEKGKHNIRNYLEVHDIVL